MSQTIGGYVSFNSRSTGSSSRVWLTRASAAMVLVVGSWVFTGTASAQVQRMAIPAGALDLLPNAVQAIEAFCLDLTRESPTSRTTYSNVLTDAAHSHVVLNGRSIPLQQAIADGKVAVEGRDMHFTDRLDMLEDPLVFSRETARMSERDRRELRQLVADWASLTPTERQEATADMDARYGTAGDHTTLRLRNLTSDPMRVVIDQTTVVSDRTEALNGVDISRVHATASGKDHLAIQRFTWLANTREDQQALRQLGYYHGSVDGNPGPATKHAVASFQRDHSLEVSGILDANTESALHDANRFSSLRLNSSQLARMRESGSRRGGIVQLRLEHDATDPARRFQVFDGAAAEPLYAGSDVLRLTESLSLPLSRSDASAVYLDMGALREDQAAGLAASIRAHQATINADIAVYGFTRSGVSFGLDDMLFERGVKLEARGSPIVEEIASGAHRGWFRVTIDFLVRLGGRVVRVSVEFLSQSRDAVVSALNAIAQRFASGTLDDTESVARSIDEALKAVHRTHPELTPQQVKTVVRGQLGALSIVDAFRLSNSVDLS